MSKKIFVHKYVRRFVYVCVTGLGCIIGHNVGMSNKIFMYKYVKMFCVHTCHRTRLHKTMWLYEVCIYVYVTGLGCIVLQEVGY